MTPHHRIRSLESLRRSPARSRRPGGRACRCSAETCSPAVKLAACGSGRTCWTGPPWLPCPQVPPPRRSFLKVSMTAVLRHMVGSLSSTLLADMSRAAIVSSETGGPKSSLPAPSSPDPAESSSAAGSPSSSELHRARARKPQSSDCHVAYLSVSDK